MKKIKPDEIYNNLRGFLKDRGIELVDEGSYTQAIRKSCGLVSQAVNLTQESLHRAKDEVENALDQARQIIHEKTAPCEAAAAPGPHASADAPQAKPGPAKRRVKAKASTKPKRAARKKT